MQVTHQGQEFRQADTLIQSNRRLLLFLVILLTTFALYLVSSAFSATGAEVNSTRSVAAAEPLASPSPSVDECLANVAWPARFEVPFVAFVPKQKFPWAHNLLQYEYLETPGMETANFRSYFPRCLNLPFVPLTFYGRPCSFYFKRDPQNNNEWQAYVYSIPLRQYFKLASNLGPMMPDFVARYQAVLPAGCADNPLPGSPVKVRNPPRGLKAQWFLTSGSRNVHTCPQTEGYYAAMAETVTGPDNKAYKPPFAFTGAPPGVGFFFGKNLDAYGELVYDWKKFDIKTSFPPGTFVPPQRYTEVKGRVMPPPQANPSPTPCASPQPTPSSIAGASAPSAGPNCIVCHTSDTSKPVTFYIERRRVAAVLVIKKKKG